MPERALEHGLLRGQGRTGAGLHGQCQQNTVLPASPVTEEEPFLFTDSSGNYNVFVPAVQHGSSGPSWASGQEAGTSLPLSKFFVASPGYSHPGYHRRAGPGPGPHPHPRRL